MRFFEERFFGVEELAYAEDERRALDRATAHDGVPEHRPRQDMHVHSTFSDGRNTIEENIAEAERIGLDELTCVDHVRAGTDWVPAYLAAVDHARARTSIALHCAVEAKILDTAGHLDAPNDLTGVEAVYAADHQVPLPEGPRDPAAVRDAIADGSLDGDEVVASLVAGTVAAVRSHDRIVIAHLFSVLPKIGLSEDDVAPELVASLAEATAAAGARIEVSERWRCPSVRNLRPFVERGVPLLLSTDSHGCETIGRYSYCAEVVRELSGVELAGVA